MDGDFTLDGEKIDSETEEYFKYVVNFCIGRIEKQ